MSGKEKPGARRPESSPDATRAAAHTSMQRRERMDFTLAERGRLPPGALQSSGLGGEFLEFGGEAGERSLAGAKISGLGVHLDGFEQRGHGDGSDIGASALDVMRHA